jgi:hypothetical protein
MRLCGVVSIQRIRFVFGHGGDQPGYAGAKDLTNAQLLQAPKYRPQRGAAAGVGDKRGALPKPFSSGILGA